MSFSNSLTIVVRAHALPSARPFFEFRYAVADLNLTFHERVSVLPLLDLNPQKCPVLCCSGELRGREHHSKVQTHWADVSSTAS